MVAAKYVTKGERQKVTKIKTKPLKGGKLISSFLKKLSSCHWLKISVIAAIINSTKFDFKIVLKRRVYYILQFNVQSRSVSTVHQVHHSRFKAQKLFENIQNVYKYNILWLHHNITYSTASPTIQLHTFQLDDHNMQYSISCFKLKVKCYTLETQEYNI